MSDKAPQGNSILASLGTLLPDLVAVLTDPQTSLAILFSMFRKVVCSPWHALCPGVPTRLSRPRSSPKACWARKPGGRRSAA
jgi:hypothetical protein